MFTCPACGTKGLPDYYREGSICAECHEAERLPANVERMEHYRYDSAMGQVNARCRLSRRIPTSERAEVYGAKIRPR